MPGLTHNFLPSVQLSRNGKTVLHRDEDVHEVIKKETRRVMFSPGQPTPWSTVKDENLKTTGDACAAPATITQKKNRLDWWQFLSKCWTS